MNAMLIDKLRNMILKQIQPSIEEWFPDDNEYKMLFYIHYLSYLDTCLVDSLRWIVEECERNLSIKPEKTIFEDIAKRIADRHILFLGNHDQETILQYIVKDPAIDAARLISGKVWRIAAEANFVDYFIHKSQYMKRFKKLEARFKEYKPLPFHQEYYNERYKIIYDIIYNGHKPKLIKKPTSN